MLPRKERVIMKKIDKDEIYGHLKDFLKVKGIELQDGSYTRQIQHGCQILADTVNLSQQALKQAKTTVGTKLDQVRQVIHEKTAPKGPGAQATREAPPAPPKAAQTEAGAKKASKSKPKKAAARRSNRPPAA
jgi:hypothetical protein